MIRREETWQHMPGEYALPWALYDEKQSSRVKRVCILGVDPGATTGLCMITVPRESLLGDAPGKILTRDSWETSESMRLQVRQVTSLALRASAFFPCLIVAEDFDLGGNRLAGAASEADVATPIRFNGALAYAVSSGQAEHSILVFQGRTLAFTTATDDRLKKWDMWDVGSDHKRAATRHAITMIRRISSGSVSAQEIWGDV